jgi:hypothetical protein
VGLVTAEEFRQKREDIQKRKDRRDDVECVRHLARWVSLHHRYSPG